MAKQQEEKKHTEHIETKTDLDEAKFDFARVVTSGVYKVMRDRGAMRVLEMAFDEAVQGQVGLDKEETNLQTRDRLRTQLQDGRKVLESLESRLMQIITG